MAEKDRDLGENRREPGGTRQRPRGGSDGRRL